MSYERTALSVMSRAREAVVSTGKVISSGSDELLSAYKADLDENDQTDEKTIDHFLERRGKLNRAVVKFREGCKLINEGIAELRGSS